MSREAPPQEIGRTLSDPARAAVLLTWVLFLLDPPGNPIIDVPLTILAILGLIVPSLCWNPWLWWTAALLTIVPVAQDWFAVDNHAFMRVYWTLAIAVAASFERPKEEFARNARQLIGLVFLFATLWKALLSPDFTDGRFLRFTFMTDSRFAEWSEGVGDLLADEQEQNRERVGDWLAHRDSEWAADMVEPTKLKLVAQFVTGTILILEFAIAVCFLWPLGRGPSRLRDPLLWCFGATTYGVARGEVLGCLLCVMGLAQCDPERPRVGISYVVLFLLVLVYARAPWIEWIVAVFE